MLVPAAMLRTEEQAQPPGLSTQVRLPALNAPVEILRDYQVLKLAYQSYSRPTKHTVSLMTRLRRIRYVDLVVRRPRPGLLLEPPTSDASQLNETYAVKKLHKDTVHDAHVHEERAVWLRTRASLLPRSPDQLPYRCVCRSSDTKGVAAASFILTHLPGYQMYCRPRTS